jgi:hypothetical protein
MYGQRLIARRQGCSTPAPPFCRKFFVQSCIPLCRVVALRPGGNHTGDKTMILSFHLSPSSAARRCRRTLACFALTIGLLIAQAPPAAAQAAENPTVDDIIKLAQARMSEAFLIKHIKREGKAYKLSAADLVRLQNAGVSEAVIEAMLEQKEPAPAPPAAEPLSDDKSAKKGGLFGGLIKDLGERTVRVAKKSADVTEQTLTNKVDDLEKKAGAKIDPAGEKGEKKADGAVGSGAVKPAARERK